LVISTTEHLWKDEYYVIIVRIELTLTIMIIKIRMRILHIVNQL